MKEYADFLSEQEPYARLDAADLVNLARHVEVEFFAAGVEIVHADGAILDSVYVVRTGLVEVVDRGSTIDVLGPGDTFGHISVLSGLRPAFAVRSIEDTLCYRLPDPRTLVAHPERLQFAHYGKQIARERLIATERAGWSRFDQPLRSVTRPITWCAPHSRVRDVAESIGRDRASCAVYLHHGVAGIATDADFREKVATGKVSVEAPVTEIGSHPAYTVADDLPIDTALITMVDRGIHHLITTDRAGRPSGVVRAVDLADSTVRTPLMVRGATEAARNLEEVVAASRLLMPTLIELFDAGLPARHLGAIHSAMLESVFRKIVELLSAGTILDQVTCSWMLLGSIGRRETLPNSDIDTALAWTANPGAPEPDPHSVIEAVMPIMKAMPACGLQPCPQGLNAVNELFNHPASRWPSVVSAWRRPPHTPDQLLRASTMLDARAITHPSLTHATRTELISGPGRKDFNAAMNALALNHRPPAGFVRGFVVERLGGPKQHLNLKKAGLRPIASLARALALQAGHPQGSTPERLDTAHRSGLLSADETESLKGAFDLVQWLAIEAQVRAIRAAEPIETVIRPADLSTLDRRHLREAFRTVTQVQERLVHQPVWGART